MTKLQLKSLESLLLDFAKDLADRATTAEEAESLAAVAYALVYVHNSQF